MARVYCIRCEFVNDGRGFCHKLLNTIIKLLPPRPLQLSLEDDPSMNKMTEALEGMSNWKAVGPDGLPAELQNIDQPAFA